jgi:hypothetical protein
MLVIAQRLAAANDDLFHALFTGEKGPSKRSH